MSKKPKVKIPRDKYAKIVLAIFERHYKPGLTTFDFTRDDVAECAQKFGVKNLGDLLYTFRFRTKLPEAIAATQSSGREWVIRLAGTGKYRFRLAKINRIVPRENQYQIKIPDATPEIIRKYKQSDEQALLAKVRYNRLIDIFLGVTAYSLQNHLRTTVPELGQIETDEVYVGVRRTGEQYIIPVQAKGGRDQLGAVQMEQDLALCRHAFPTLTPRLVAVQFQKDSDVIVMFEIVVDEEEDDLKVLDERHYRLVPAADISDADMKTMAQTT